MPREKNPLWYQTKLIDVFRLRQLWQCKNSESLTAVPSTGVLPADHQNFWKAHDQRRAPNLAFIVADPPLITALLRHGDTRFPSLPLNPDSAGEGGRRYGRLSP